MKSSNGRLCPPVGEGVRDTWIAKKQVRGSDAMGAIHQQRVVVVDVSTLAQMF